VFRKKNVWQLSMELPATGESFEKDWAALAPLLAKACHLPPKWLARPSLRCSLRGATLLVTWTPAAGGATAENKEKQKRRSPASKRRSEARRTAHVQKTAKQQSGAPAAAPSTAQTDRTGTNQQQSILQEQQPRLQPAAAPAQEEEAVVTVVDCPKPPHTPPRIQPPASKRRQLGPPAAIVRIGTEEQGRVDGTASSRKRPKGSAGRLADQLIPEEVGSKMHPRLRVEICNWVTNVQHRHISPEQPWLDMMGRWVHWGSEPFIDSSGCNTTTWKQAYIIVAAVHHDLYVCTIFQTLRNQLKPGSLACNSGFGGEMEAKWDETLRLLKPH
jgi:hypothetical protein